MHPPILLAHGALGIYDEVIFIGIVAFFVGMMGISWVVSRNTNPDLDDSDSEPTSEPEQSETEERFKLD
jgi:hypothetical protein